METLRCFTSRPSGREEAFRFVLPAVYRQFPRHTAPQKSLVVLPAVLALFFRAAAFSLSFEVAMSHSPTRPYSIPQHESPIHLEPAEKSQIWRGVGRNSNLSSQCLVVLFIQRARYTRASPTFRRSGESHGCRSTNRAGHLTGH